jgi:hypothetical protein
MARLFPARIIRIHDVTGIAEARLAGNFNRSDDEKRHQDNQQKNLCRPSHLSETVDR